MIYRLKLPITVSFVVDENELQIRSLKDLDFIQSKYDVDLQHIVDEYEYKLETEENFLEEEEDFVTINKTDILQSVIDDNMDEISEIFYREEKLSSFDKKDIQKIFEITQEDFNSRQLLKGYNGNFTVNSIEITSIDVENESFIIEVDINRELDPSELSELRNTIEHKCVDDWGTDFEETDLSDELNEDMYVYIKCWDDDKPIEFINI